MDALRFLEEATEMEERRREAALGHARLRGAEQREVRAEADLAMGVIVDLLEDLR